MAKAAYYVLGFSEDELGGSFGENDCLFTSP